MKAHDSHYDIFIWILLLVLEGWPMKDFHKSVKKDAGNFNVINTLVKEGLAVHRIKKASKLG